MRFVERKQLVKRVLKSLERSPCTALLGPRQCGKTTIARRIAQQRDSEYFDLEDPTAQARLQNPKMVLERLGGLIVIDEIQRRPDLFPLLRVLLDREPLPAKFLLLGSASPDVAKGVSESLAGRVEFVPMSGFSCDDVGQESMHSIWFRGGFPRSFLAENDVDSLAWRENFIQTFLERDIRQLGFDLPAQTLRRFLTMLAHYHGQTWNASEIASSLQLAHTTARRYLDIMTGTFIVRQLAPWFENVGKRVVKSPKVYFRDSGLMHALLRIREVRDLESHPKLGASWEGFGIEEILRLFSERDAYFWATYGGAEIDLMIVSGNRRLGFEFKATDKPSTTKAMRIAIRDLRLDHLYIVHPGADSFTIDENISALTIREAYSQFSGGTS